MNAGSVRARVRAEMTEEIKATARRHLATDGANLSLRAVARDMGMASSAVYRYFASRDDLLTTLIIDAYNALGTAAEQGDAAIEKRTDLRGRWLSVCRAVRRWALDHPAEYALIFGSPVPGYAAPDDTVAPALRTPVTLIWIIVDGVASGALADPGPEGIQRAVRADITRIKEDYAPDVPVSLLTRGTIGWIHLFGAVSFEIFGQLNNVIEAREAYFDLQMNRMADLVGL